MIQYRVTMGPSTYARVIRNFAAVDEIVDQTAVAVGGAARAAYRAASPSTRVAKAITTSNRKARGGGTGRIIKTGVKKGNHGGEIHGRDVGFQALAMWTDSGTADGGTGKIFRKNGEPFMHWGYPVPWVSGQAPQRWVSEARGGADAATLTLVAVMNDRAQNALRQGA